MSKVCVLMSTYNGERYLSEQVQSVINQRNVDIELFIRDDGSKDNTLNVLLDFEKKDNRIHVIEGKNIGAKFSFLELVNIVDSDAEYYAFCDQDDVWLENKLFEAIQMIKKEKVLDLPALYYSHTTIVDENLKIMNIKNPYNKNKEYSFGEIMIKNCASGCTMVFNKKMRDLINKEDIKNLTQTPLHDHWIYMICLAVGGKIIFDNRSFILYRQHSSNVIGGKRSLLDKIKESPLLKKESTRYSWAIQLKKEFNEYITVDNRKKLNIIVEYKENFIKTVRLAIDKDIKPTEIIEKIIVFLTVLKRGF